MIPALLGCATGLLGLLGQPVSGADAGADAGARHPRFEVQTYGSIDNAAGALAVRLGLTEAQRTQLIVLMEQRARSFATRQAAAEHAFRGGVEAVLTGAQRSKVDWSEDDRWTTLAR